MKIVWTQKAINSFSNILEFLELTWGEKQIQNFYLLTDEMLLQIKQNPFLFKASDKKPNVRIGFIHKNISLFYTVNNNEIILLFFFDNRSDSAKL